jgi:hypothetical protein
MKNILFITLLSIFIYGCGTDIKNRNAEVVEEEGTQITDNSINSVSDSSLIKDSTITLHSMLGYWVGYFEIDEEKMSNTYEGEMWQRENKINISIDEINENQVKGHSVVAGNDRPFAGTMKKIDNSYYFEVEEPGNHKYDGKFIFSIFPNQLTGKWTAYKDINVKHRAYKLEKKEFTYNPNLMLEKSRRYIDWTNYIEQKEAYETDDGEVQEWISKWHLSSSDEIYLKNASSKLLTKDEVANLKKGDLVIIRNAIYARHGYSFKNRPMRVFFDAQEWYVPVHTDIKSDFTDIEKENIKLLLRYEKNAAEYYDYFGR